MYRCLQLASQHIIYTYIYSYVYIYIYVGEWPLDGRVASMRASEFFTRPRVGDFSTNHPSHGDFRTIVGEILTNGRATLQGQFYMGDFSTSPK